MKKSLALLSLALLFTLGLFGRVAFAQNISDEIAKYREMIADGNPAELYAAAGEEIWVKQSGPKQATLQQCDLGKGPGIVKGAFAELPRYFSDTNRVQDIESRLMTCMENLQGIAASDVLKDSFGKGLRKDLEAVVAYVVTESKDLPIKVVPKHPKEKEMAQLGAKIFFYQAGPMDFSCATCHSQNNKRIRLQDLPNITTAKGAAEAWGSWPAYRVSSGEFWTMQRRLNDCFRQQRLPMPIYGSDATVALSMYMASKGNGGIIQTPGLKR